MVRVNVKVKESERHMGALDRYYMEICPGCSMPTDDCQTGSTNETSCILAGIREILLRIETVISGGKTDGR